MVLTSLAPMLVSRLGRSRFLTKRMGPTVPVALAHPLASPVRTAVVMAMFSITVFSVVVLSGYTEQFDNYSSSFVEETEGEFELMLTSSRSRPQDKVPLTQAKNSFEKSFKEITKRENINNSKVSGEDFELQDGSIYIEKN